MKGAVGAENTTHRIGGNPIMCHDDAMNETGAAHRGYRKRVSETPVIGLTGGIAAGKTSVSAGLARRGAHVIDADSVGHRVLEPGGEAYDDVLRAFGKDILDADGRIDRRKLGSVIFADPQKRRQLNAISHPHMAQRMSREIARVRGRQAPPPLIVLDAAILLEAGWDALCDEVWTVSVDSETATGRLISRNGLTADQAHERIAAQWNNRDRESRAQRVIRNEGSLDELTAQVERIWYEVTGRAAS